MAIDCSNREYKGARGDWPEGLPILNLSKKITLGDTTSSVTMASGFMRRRKRFGYVPDTVEGSMTLNIEQFNILKDWYYSDIKEIDFFTMPIKMQGDAKPQLYKTRFTTQMGVNQIVPFLVRVTLPLEVWPV